MFEDLLMERAASAPSHAPTMGNLDKVKYSHIDMIDFIIAHPACRLEDIAKRYGYTVSWICNVQASDAWKSAMAKRRSELVDPIMHATLTERFEGMTVRSVERLMEKLNAPVVSDQVVLRAVELGAKAMGIGGNAASAPPPIPSADHLAVLAQRLIALQSQVRGQSPQEIPYVEVVSMSDSEVGSGHPVH